jgi:type II secretion system protein H
VTCRRGFTLVELLTVLTIMVVLAALVAPSFVRQFQTARLSSAAREIVALMRYARSEAVVAGATYRLNIDSDGGRLWVTYYDSGDNERDAGFVPDTSVLGGARVLPEGVRMGALALGDEALAQLSDEALSAIRSQQQQLNEEGTPYITFSPQGTTDGARVLLENDYDDTLAVTLDAITGKAEIKEADEVTGDR